MNFRDYATRPHACLTPSQLEEARALVQETLCTGWDQDAYEAMCGERPGDE